MKVEIDNSSNFFKGINLPVCDKKYPKEKT